MRKRNYLIMFCLLFVLFTYVFGADTLYFSIPEITFSNEILCHISLRPTTCDSMFRGNHLDKSVKLPTYPDFGRDKLKTDWAYKVFFIDTVKQILTINKRNEITGKAKFSHVEAYETGGHGFSVITYKLIDKPHVSLTYTASEDAIQYYNRELELFNDNKFTSSVIDSLKKQYLIFSEHYFGYILNDDTIQYCELTYRTTDSTKIRGAYKYVTHSQIFQRTSSGSKEVMHWENDYGVGRKVIVTSFTIDKHPVLIFETSIPESGFGSFAIAAWKDNKYVASDQPLIIE